MIVAKLDHKDALAIISIGVGAIAIIANREKIIAVVQPTQQRANTKHQQEFKTSRGW
jgi:hypothetical protein